jgi:hypothetical protein
MFGDIEATVTTFWSDKCLNYIAPPAFPACAVEILFRHEHPFHSSNRGVFIYLDDMIPNQSGRARAGSHVCGSLKLGGMVAKSHWIRSRDRQPCLLFLSRQRRKKGGNRTRTAIACWGWLLGGEGEGGCVRRKGSSTSVCGPG